MYRFKLAKVRKTYILFFVIAVVFLVIAYAVGGNLDDDHSNKKDNTIIASTSTNDLATKENDFDDVSKKQDNTKKSNVENATVSTQTTTQEITKVTSENKTETTNATTSPNTSNTNNSNVETTKNVNISSNSKNNLNSTDPTEIVKPTNARTEKDKYLTDPVPAGKPEPVEPQTQETINKNIKCTFSISCSTILDNMQELDKDKVELVPNDGWILKPITVTFKEGESVFDVLQNICKENKIHMESSFTPMYNSAYIEGINNLYEFDCGSLSGWMYSVNGWFPNYGCSRYQLKDGDVVEWKYTCDLGYDVGGGYATGG